MAAASGGSTRCSASFARRSMCCARACAHRPDDRRQRTVPYRQQARCRVAEPAGARIGGRSAVVADVGRRVTMATNDAAELGVYVDRLRRAQAAMTEAAVDLIMV